jgi:hypothetical protein
VEVPGSLVEDVTSLRQRLAGFEPGEYSGASCAQLAEELAFLEKGCAAARLLAASRAVDTGAHKQQGFNDANAWLARQSGTTRSQAREALDTARRLEECPDTKAALRAGEISLAQAAEITKAEAEVDGAESELLALARKSDLTRLRDGSRELRQTACDAGELRRRQLAAREFQHWRDRDGMIRFRGALPPETGLPFVHRVEAGGLRLRQQTKVSGRQAERFEAYAADALVELVSGAASGDAPKQTRHAELVIVCDIYAWRRGHTHRGEVCHVIDGGPIPVDVARELSEDAFLKAVLHDGVDIHTVKHFGRHYPAALRTALDLGPVPGFTGRQCVDCGSRWSLEYDHIDPVAHQGATEYANLAPRCWKDHRAKTERDRSSGLLGPRARPPDTS